MIPYDRRLALHGARLILMKPLQQRERFRDGKVRHDAAVLRFDASYRFRRHDGA